MLFLMHWLFSWLAVRSHGFGVLIKDRPRVLVRQGELDRTALRTAHMTEHDLDEDLRQKGLTDAAEIAEARLERSGQVSVIKAKGEPKVVEVPAAAGVQTIRIEIG